MSMDNPKSSGIGGRLRMAREMAGLSQSQVAKMLSLHRPSISEMEAGRSLFDLGGLYYELQECLGVKVDVVTRKGLRTRIRERVMNEAEPL